MTAIVWAVTRRSLGVHPAKELFVNLLPEGSERPQGGLGLVCCSFALQLGAAWAILFGFAFRLAISITCATTGTAHFLSIFWP